MDRRDVVDRALVILGQVGLPDLTMRRLGTELGVQQSALYHHFANKQALLGAVADEIVRRGPVTDVPDGADGAGWGSRVRAAAVDLRTAVLAYPDGADVVSSMVAFGLGGAAPHERLSGLLREAGLPPEEAAMAARTLQHYVHGHAVGQQARETAARIGAIESPPALLDPEADFLAGLDLVLTGIGSRVAAVSGPRDTLAP